MKDYDYLNKINRLIAIHIFDYTWEVFGKQEPILMPPGSGSYIKNEIAHSDRFNMVYEAIPDFTGDIAAAWSVVDKLSHMDPGIMQYGEEDGSWTWYVDFEGTNSSIDNPVRDKNIALAICLAALKAKGVKKYGDVLCMR